MIEDKGTLKPRAYARLLTMIGDQLIKNEKVALIELIKNSYDADANWVQIQFNNFRVDKDGNTLVKTENSNIEIEDDGLGMSFDTIKSAWLNPATPNKIIQKQDGENLTKKKRIIQGEKGIGRFAVYKLGTTIELTTKSIGKNEKEILLLTDLSSFDDELIHDGLNKTIPKYLDEIEYLYEIRNSPVEIVEKKVLIRGKIEHRLPHGTIIRITNLRGEWSFDKIGIILSDISKLNNPITAKASDSFVCEILVNGQSQFKPDSDYKEDLLNLQSKAPIRITEGEYDGVDKISYKVNDSAIELNLERLLEIKEFRRRFGASDKRSLKRFPDCGPFTFQFHVYDLTNQAPLKYKLLKDEKEIIKNNRIYLYRDGMRVFPYGDKVDDWLEVDMLRGTGRAGDYLSNDQTVGFIGISTEKNPYLKDKTSREGLLEIGNAFEDFKTLIQGILGLLLNEYKKYRFRLEAKTKIALVKESITQNQFESFREYLSEIKDSKGSKVFEVIYKNYINEKKYLKERAEITEDLAAVGIAVEAASHDLMMMMQRANATLSSVIEMTESKKYDPKMLNSSLKKLLNQIKFIESQIEGIQPIFRSSKRQNKDLKITSIITDVKRYYEGVIQENNISFLVEETVKNFTVNCTEAVLLQTFINLLDNAVYWLKTIDTDNKKILIKIDKDKAQVIFADNGPGVRSDDLPFIFEPFFSTKGMQGRGLGLYIATQLLGRHDFEISYITDKTNKILSGANLLIDFSKQNKSL
jgi:signal transduction histidine kinase